MKVLVVGGGGREHALAWKLAQSAQVETVYAAPGNPGIASLAKGQCLPIAAGDSAALVAAAKEHAVRLVVVGPEDPLAAGLVDALEAAGIRAFGPSAAAARLEGSKRFAKAFMAEHGIPTAGYAAFSDAASARDYVRVQGAPIVIKADGLAAGKGVTVCATVAEAEAAIDRVLVDGAFGAAGRELVVEAYLEGEEASVFALCDGERAVPLVASQDHKPVFDDDRGPNTGGMGAVAPAPLVTPALMAEVQRRILDPVVAGMAQAGTPYRGLLYAGLMLGADGPQVVEFNVRFGDPETQVVLPLLEDDLLPLLLGCAEGHLPARAPTTASGACVTVVMASGGYPGNYEKGLAIRGIEQAERREGVRVFHAGTAEEDGQLVTGGGRVLCVTAQSSSLQRAQAQAYHGVGDIAFEGAHYRTDIGRRAIERMREAIPGAGS